MGSRISIHHEKQSEIPEWELRLSGLSSQETILLSTGNSRQHDHANEPLETQWLLPDNIWLRIFSFLTLQERNQASCTCKRWNSLCKDALFWREVDFQFCSFPREITDEIVKAVVSYSTRIQSLDLSGDHCEPITDDSLGHVANFCPRLQRLNIAGRKNVSNRGLSLIARNCLLLEELNVEKCQGINDKGLHSVAKNSRRLRVLSVAGCKKISDKGIEVVVEKCRNMQNFNLAGCIGISDKSLTRIGKHCRSLRSISLKDTNNITSYGIESLVSGTPEMTHVHLGVIRDTQNTMIALQVIMKHCEKLQFLSFQHFHRTGGVAGGVRKVNKNKLGPFINSLNACVVSNYQR
ncbi:F-box/LRR-repeat protein 20-like isoform X2 [Montipora capricornis]|uniref:F-box/LRR-repeat protein 20-like isoform X2 n=1 Tax=Montipora capricornis TaxID=246305 RepID=UPI0035F123D8